MAVAPHSRGRPHPDRRTDILYRIASKKVGSPTKLIPLFQEKLAAELGTTRRTIDAICEQYEGMDLGEVLGERFSNMKLFKAPTAWMLDDDKGELLSHVFESEFRGLCTNCATWAWIPMPLPPFITCDGCGAVYFEETDSHGEVNLSSCQSLYETRALDFPEYIRLILKGGPKYVPFKRGPFPSYAVQADLDEEDWVSRIISMLKTDTPGSIQADLDEGIAEFNAPVRKYLNDLSARAEVLEGKTEEVYVEAGRHE